MRPADKIKQQKQKKNDNQDSWEKRGSWRDKCKQKKKRKTQQLANSFFPSLKKKTGKGGLKGEVKNHNHMAGRKGILRKANLCCLQFVLLPLFFILHLAHFDFQARKLGHEQLSVQTITTEEREIQTEK